MTDPVSAAAGAVSAVAHAVAAIANAADRPDDVQRMAQRLRISTRRAASLGVLARRNVSPARRAEHAARVEMYDAALRAMDAVG